MSISTRSEPGQESPTAIPVVTRTECQGHLNESHRNHPAQDDHTTLEVDIWNFHREDVRFHAHQTLFEILSLKTACHGAEFVLDIYVKY